MDKTGTAVSQVLKQLRLERNLSQAAVAEALNVPLRTYQTWEKEYSSGIGNLIMLANYYEIPADRFFVWINKVASGHDAAMSRPVTFSVEIAHAVLEGLTGEEIANRLPSCFRRNEPVGATVDRALLDVYFESGFMFFQDRFPRNPELECLVAQRFTLPIEQVRVVQTAPVRSQIVKEIALASHGAALIEEWSRGKAEFRLGVSNGYTVARILDHIPRNGAGNMMIFPLNFTMTPADFSISTTSLISSFIYRHQGCYNEQRLVSEKEVYGAMQLADAAILGIGTFRQEGLYARMVRATLGSSFLDTMMKSGAIGDFNYHMLASDGNVIPCPQLISDIGDDAGHSLIKAIGIDLLTRKADRGCHILVAAAGEHKAELVRLALGRRYVNSLLVDSSLALGLLNQS